MEACFPSGEKGRQNRNKKLSSLSCKHSVQSRVGAQQERGRGRGMGRDTGAERREKGELGEQHPCLRAWWAWAPSQAAGGRRPMAWWRGLKQRAPCAELQARPRRERASSSGDAKLSKINKSLLLWAVKSTRNKASCVQRLPRARYFPTLKEGG